MKLKTLKLLLLACLIQAQPAATLAQSVDFACKFTDVTDFGPDTNQIKMEFSAYNLDYHLYWEKTPSPLTYTLSEALDYCKSRNMKVPMAYDYSEHLRGCFERSGQFGERLSERGLAELRAAFPDMNGQFWTEDTNGPTYYHYAVFNAIDGSMGFALMTERRRVRCLKTVIYP